MWLRLMIGCFAILLFMGGAEATQEHCVGPACKSSKKNTKQQNTPVPVLVTVSEPKKELKPDINTAYVVTLVCKKNLKIKDKSSFERLLNDSFIRTKRSMSLFLTFHTEPQKSKPDGTPEVPGGILSAIPVFSHEIGGGKDNIFDGFDQCNRQFLLYGKSDVYVSPIFSVSDKREAGAIFTILQSAADAATPFTALLGVQAAADAANKFVDINANINKLKDHLDKVVKLIDQDVFRVVPFRLFVTSRTITIKDVGTIDISVKPLKSILSLADKHPELLEALRNVMTEIASKVPSGKSVKDACNNIVMGLNMIGIRAPDDIAYSLLWSSNRLGIKTEYEVLTCLLNPEYAYAAAGLPKNRKPAGLGSDISEADVRLVHGQPPQPDYELIASPLSDIVNYLSSFPSYKERLLSLFSENFSVTNTSRADLHGLLGSAVVAEATFEKLRELGYRRFGCYGRTDENTGSQEDKASGFFLMFQADNSNNSVCLSKTLMVRPFFDPANRVNNLTISGNEDWIRNVLKNRNPQNRCGDSRITVDLDC
jgi:hypothetical protein